VTTDSRLDVADRTRQDVHGIVDRTTPASSDALSGWRWPRWVCSPLVRCTNSEAAPRRWRKTQQAMPAMMPAAASRFSGSELIAHLHSRWPGIQRFAGVLKTE
jgi:hypothetical protein